MRKKILFLIVVLLGIFTGCSNREAIEKGKAELIQTDLEFSKLSEEKGMHESFLAYWDENGILIRDSSYPIVGKEAIKKLYDAKSDKGFVLTWKPSYSDISESCDLGFTYGIWELNLTGKEGLVEKENGTYVTVWRKDINGKWKMALDTGCDGLEPKK